MNSARILTTPKRILHVSTWQVPCGIATYCESFIKALDLFGVESRVAPIHPVQWQYSLPQDILEWRDRVIAASEGCDLVHIQHEHGLFGHGRGTRFSVRQFGALIKRLRDHGKPVVTTFHTDIITCRRKQLRAWFDRIRKRRFWWRHVARHFSEQRVPMRAIVHCPRTRLSFVRHGFDVHSLNVLPHACHAPKQFLISRENAKATLGFSPQSKLITIFGFLGKYKGHDLAVEALRRLPDDYELALVGGMHPESNDSFLDEVLQSIPIDLHSRVRVTGWVESTIADLYYAATDVCLAPYRQDTLLSASGAVTWALSSGRPVIASKIEAFQNVNRGYDCLFLVTPEKLAELAWAIEKLVADSSLQERLVAGARKYCAEHSWKAIAERTLHLYEPMLASSRGNASPSVPARAA